MKLQKAYSAFLLLATALFTGCPTAAQKSLSVCDRFDTILLKVHDHHLTAPSATRFVLFNAALRKFYQTIGVQQPLTYLIPANGTQVSDLCKQAVLAAMQKKIAEDDAILLMLDHYLRSLDPHSRVDDISDLTDAAKLTALPRRFGFRLDLTQTPPRIQEVWPGSPAHLEGIEEDSQLLKVNDIDVSKATPEALSTLREKLSKNSGKVRLYLEKPDGMRREYVLRQDFFVEAAVEFQNIPIEHGFIGYIKLRRFNDASDRLYFAQTLQGMDRASAIILDLRDNRGGDVEAAAEIANEFIVDGGTFAAFADQSGRTIETLRYPRANSIWDGPLVVIVNRGTRSAAELLAAALQDNGKVVVGEQTAGEGTTQIAIPLKENFGLMATAFVTDAFDYRPSGVSTQLDGVTPNVFVDQSSMVSKNVLREKELKNRIEKPGRRIDPLSGYDSNLSQHAEEFLKPSKQAKPIKKKRKEPLLTYSKDDAAIDAAARIGHQLCKDLGRCR